MNWRVIWAGAVTGVAIAGLVVALQAPAPATNPAVHSKPVVATTIPTPSIADQNCLMYQTGVMVCSSPEGKVISVSGVNTPN